MTREIEKSIDLSYKMLAVAWAIGALGLAFAVWSEKAPPPACTLEAWHLQAC
jgi:hypothetical protein